MLKGVGRAAWLLHLFLLLVGLALSGCAVDPREALPQITPTPPEKGSPSSPLDCTTAQGVSRRVCDNDELTALDRRLGKVFASVESQTPEAQRATLRAVQQGWIRGRDECSKQGDAKSGGQRRCIAELYQRRIAELQAQYALVEQRGPLHFMCGDRPANEVTVTWFETEPKTLIAERGDSASLMYHQAGTGPDYRGRNESLSEHRDAITIVWGLGAPRITCQRAPE